MQVAYRWYSVRLAGSSIGARALAKRVVVLKGDSWFQVDHTESGRFRFFRKSEIWFEQFDHTGEAIRQRVEGISATTFTVFDSDESTILRVENPGRNMQFLMAALETALGFGFSAKPLAMDSWIFSSVLKRADVSKLVSLKITNVVVRPDCVGRMEFASKEGITSESIPLLKDLSFKQDLVKYELIYKGLRGHFSASASGLVRIGGALSPFILELLERDIRRIAMRKCR